MCVFVRRMVFANGFRVDRDFVFCCDGGVRSMKSKFQVRLSASKKVKSTENHEQKEKRRVNWFEAEKS